MRTKNLSQKYFVNKNSQISVQCLACKKSRIFPVETLREKQHTVKVKCPCKNTFIIDIEFRNYYRKKVNITGGYRVATAPVEETKSCTITDLSLGGLSIKIINDASIRVKDQLIVNFRLDDSAQHLVERIIKVRHVDPKERIGGEFMESVNNDQDDSVLFFYL